MIEDSSGAARFRSLEDFLRAERTRCIAHRGFSGRCPENTLASFRAAIEVQADMIELDVTLTADDEVVVIHDETLERTTDGRGPVREQHWGELATLDAGSWLAPSFAGERIPTLAQVLELTRGRTLLNIEVKEEVVTDRIEGGIVERVIQRVLAAEMSDQVILSSFDPRAVAQAQAIEPEIERASLFNLVLHRGRRPTEVMEEVGAVVFSASLKQASAAMVADAHASGRLVTVYTVNHEPDMQRMIDLGVDGMFTDHPDVLLRLSSTSS